MNGAIGVAFFATVGIRRKTRVHFHAFMRDVHEELARLKNEADPLAAQLLVDAEEALGAAGGLDHRHLGVGDLPGRDLAHRQREGLGQHLQQLVEDVAVALAGTPSAGSPANNLLVPFSE